MAYIHEHNSNEWNFTSGLIFCGKDVHLGVYHKDDKEAGKEAEAIKKLVVQAPKLLQIAEMYLDQLESLGKGHIFIANMIRETIVNSGVEITK